MNQSKFIHEFVLSNCDIHILIRELSILIRELKHCMLLNLFDEHLKLSNWSLQKPEQKSRRRRQPRQDKKEAVMTGPTPECTHNAGE